MELRSGLLLHCQCELATYPLPRKFHWSVESHTESIQRLYERDIRQRYSTALSFCLRCLSTWSRWLTPSRTLSRRSRDAVIIISCAFFYHSREDTYCLKPTLQNVCGSTTILKFTESTKTIALQWSVKRAFNRKNEWIHTLQNYCTMNVHMIVPHHK